MKELEIYVHIPFCVKKCKYCDFLSFPGNGQLQQEYINKLKEEIVSCSDMLRDRKAVSVFIGGGTPSLLDAELIADVMDTIHASYDLSTDAEITIECNPGSTLRHKFARYREAGINRISIGLQSADNRELKTLGRVHSFEEFLKCYQGARMEGFGNINIDLINCFPTQTPESWKRTLKSVLMLRPEHLSVYNLQLEEGTPLFEAVEKGELSMPSEEDMTKIDQITKELTAAGKMKRYEISNYSREGYECKHNKGYWTGREYIGFGLGSSSLLNDVRFKNCSDYENYRIRKATPKEWDAFLEEKETVERLTDREKMREFMILGLRLTEGVGSIDFYREFGLQMNDVYGSVIEKFLRDGLLAKDGYDVHLTERGMDLANLVMREF